MMPIRCLLLMLLVCPLVAAAQEPDVSTRKFLAANGLFQRQLYKLAAQEYDQFLAASPKHEYAPTARYALAICHYRLGQFAPAASELEKCLADESFKQPQDALLVLGYCYRSITSYDKALGAFDRLLALKPPGEIAATAMLNKAQVLYLMGRKAESATTCQQFLTDYPQAAGRGEASLLLGINQVGLGQIDQARQSLQQVITTDKAQGPTANYWLAQCDMAQKQFAAALPRLEQLVGLQPPPPNSDRIAMDRAQCLMGLDRFDDGAKAFAAFIVAYPTSALTDEAAYRQAFCLHKLGQYRQSIEACRKVADPGSFAEPARQLAAENFFLINDYAAAAKAFSQLREGNHPPEQEVRFALRLGQCAYFSGDYAKAAELLSPLADRVKADPELSGGLLLLGDALLHLGKHHEAAAVLSSYAAVAKQDKPEAMFRLATAQLGEKDTGAAEKTLSQLMKGPADSPWTLRAAYEFGQRKYKQHQPAEAAAALRPVATSTNELAPSAAYLLAWIDYEAKRYGPAAAGFSAMAAKFPKDPLAKTAIFYQAVSLKEDGQTQKALDAFTAFVQSNPTDKNAASARQLMANCLVKLERYPPAIAALSALATDPATTTDQVLYDLAWSQRANKDSPSAKQTYERLLASYSNSPLATSARSELGDILFEEKHFAEAASLLEKAAADSKADHRTLAVAIYRLGLCYQKMGQTTKAASAYNRFLAQHAGDDLAGWVHYQAGINCLEQSQYEPAIEHFRLLTRGGSNGELAALATLKLGETQAASSNYVASEKTYQQFLSKFAGSRLAYEAEFGLGWAKENQQQYDAAREHYQRAIAAGNTATAARAQFQIGETYFAQGNYEQAVAALLAVVDVYAYPQWTARAIFEAGRAFEQLKQLDQAKTQYRQVIEKYKDAPEAALAAKRLAALGGESRAK